MKNFEDQGPASSCTLANSLAPPTWAAFPGFFGLRQLSLTRMESEKHETRQRDCTGRHCSGEPRNIRAVGERWPVCVTRCVAEPAFPAAIRRKILRNFDSAASTLDHVPNDLFRAVDRFRRTPSRRVRYSCLPEESKTDDRWVVKNSIKRACLVQASPGELTRWLVARGRFERPTFGL